MGRKRRGEAPALLLLLLGALLASASGDHEVGCIFSRNLCNPEVESCYNDMAFGRCVPTDGSLSDKDLYQYSLEPEELELLRLQLERLEFEGYKWPHYYTQCVMQILLDDLRYRTNNDVEDLCNHLKRLDDDNLDEGIIDREVIENLANEENPMAIVRFTPSQVNPHGEFADEFYYPPNMRQGTADEQRNVASFANYGDGFRDELDSIGDPDKVYRRGSRSLGKNSMGPVLSSNYPKESYPIPPEYLESLQGSLDGMGRLYEPTDDLEFLSFKKPVTIDQALEDYMKAFSGKYKYPKTLDSADFLDEDVDDDKDDDSDGIIGKAIPESVLDTLGQQTGIYSEAGHILPLRRDSIRPEEYDDLSMDPEMFWSRELAGFKRRERLDVKKPGPPFSTNNYAFKTQSPPPNEEGISGEEVDEDQVLYLPQQVKKEIYNSKLNNSPRTLENVDLDHVYIIFNQRFNSWPEGERVVNMVESLIGLQRGELREIRVGMAEVTFKVGENSKKYNATDIVDRIREVKDELRKQLNIEVVRAGIGDKVKLPAILEVKTNAMEMSSSMFGALVAGGVAAVSAAAIVILVVARRHAKSRAKLAGLRTPDPEASKDYQELCRARMHAKQADKLSDSPRPFNFGRLIESGRSESNRSSTSSWGDEPAVTNMDIATGHVVLSYMEEHLKNTEKLDQEWAALCVYEAEPCSTAIAEAEGNAECNRPGAALPYDHSRVVLNDLANLNNTDYINASTITDHDPRNPAYIATQGPLPATAADFWQLVWEQGSVVIVMLTRLTEEGHAMCHRYWPDEGSECYHIYEVHLVSEHIWCDDYLVRSFYLKNLRTGETRTVTQFHFLTWPNSGVPHSTKALLEFRRKVNKSYRGRSCPIIVHCSDGAGRTGTYCLIDMVLNRMSKGAKEIDIAATLEHIRDQRSGMVSSKQQYEFVLMAVAEEVHAILKSLPIVAEKQTPAAAAAATTDKPTTSKSDK